MTSKRILDLAIAIPALTLLLPLMIVVAIWITADSKGPFIYSQKRIGRCGVPFNILKFRTMIVRKASDDLSSTEHPLIRPPHQDSTPAFHSLRLSEAIKFPILKMLALRLYPMRRLLTTSTCSRGRQIRSTLKDLLSVGKPDVCIVSD